MSDEGDLLLGRELRGNYLSIMRTLSGYGPCTRAELIDILGGSRSSIGHYLKSLVGDLALVERETPIMASDRTRSARYIVADPFLRTWLACLRPAVRDIRNGLRSGAIARLLDRLRTLEGLAFERMVREASREASAAGKYDFRLSEVFHGYWNHPHQERPQIEIDFIAYDERSRRVRFGSCKRHALKHDRRSTTAFCTQVEMFLATKPGRRFRGWIQDFTLFAPSFPLGYKAKLESEGWICKDLLDFRAMHEHAEEGKKGTLVAYQGLWREL